MSRPNTINLFDMLDPDQAVQLRDPEGNVLWEGLSDNGRITAVITFDEGVVSVLTLTDGTEIYKFDAVQLVRKGDTFSWLPDFTFRTV
jgi:hypothetical protein